MNAPTRPALLVLIPLKALSRAKTRLASSLTPEQRHALVHAMLHHVLRAVAQAGVPARPLVVAGDGATARLARSLGSDSLPEAEEWRLAVTDCGSGVVDSPDIWRHAALAAEAELPLNQALADALAWAESEGVESALILPADLPTVTAADIATLWSLVQMMPSPAAVIAPDAREEGTNALLLRPPQALMPRFGGHSFQRHLAAARAAGINIRVYRAPGLARDVDRPEDLCYLTASCPWR